MTENSSEELEENFDGKKRRSALFGLLSHVLLTAEEKFDCEKASNADRLKWGRLIVQGVEAYGRLLETAAVDDLVRRVELLEMR